MIELDSRLTTLAAYALRQAQHADAFEDTINVGLILSECGMRGLWLAMQAWVDTSVPPAHEYETLSFLGPDGTVTGADDAAPPVRWAGRFMLARAQNDREQCQALVRSVDDDAALTAGILALLHMCGLQCRLRGVWT
ncbi:hypothetical protein [Sciscionella sediminilitoris]|uniref:hypothetical protein n=1 Tax=Sciscionella sediminilitoris TaxID=1445613 RepID=UPI0004DFB607|nr:hypothetical protein [Sciscionella sp. SE31]